MKTPNFILTMSAIAVISAATFAATQLPEPPRATKDWQIKHYCDLVALHEETKHLQPHEIKGHSAYLGDEQCKG